MLSLWKDADVRNVLGRRRVRMEECSGFYLDDIPRITALRYIPNNDDVLKAHLKTLGVVEHTFTIKGADKGVEWKIYDVGGARHQRQAWAPYFEDVNAIIFLTPISAFDQVLAEDITVNRLEDSLLLWKEVVQNKLLANINIILFLNKIDLLKAKFEVGVQLCHHMISYGDRPNDFDSVCKYFRNKFSALHQSFSPNKERELYSASLLICYALVGFVVYVTLLLLGEMATQYPIAGSFTTYATLFISPSYGFALAWNYWFNDAVSVASDLTAAQLVLHFWTDSNHYSWLVSLAFFIFLLALNAATVSAYGELEYLLSTLKVLTIIAFTLVGILVNLGINRHHAPIGFENWTLPGATLGFVDGFAGFAKVFVTASFAYGGTESLGITAGETRNPSKNMPRVVKFVFWRILLFYVFSVFIIGLNVPYTYPNLSNRSTTTSPFTIVFYESGSNIAASFMNTVILTSVLSAGNHAMFAGTRVLYGLSSSNPPLAPALFSRTTKHGVPVPELLATSSISILCFASSFVGSGVLWGWLQNVVGVSNQIAWLSIGLASLRFRRAWILQGRPLSEMKFRAGWTWGWGPPFVIVTVSAFILNFLSFYIELPVMALMYALYLVSSRHRRNSKHTTGGVSLSEYDEDGDRNGIDVQTPIVRGTFSDLVDICAVDLTLYEYAEGVDDVADDERREANLRGRWGWVWGVWYFVA